MYPRLQSGARYNTHKTSSYARVDQVMHYRKTEEILASLKHTITRPYLEKFPPRSTPVKSFKQEFGRNGRCSNHAISRSWAPLHGRANGLSRILFGSTHETTPFTLARKTRRPHLVRESPQEPRQVSDTKEIRLHVNRCSWASCIICSSRSCLGLLR